MDFAFQNETGHYIASLPGGYTVRAVLDRDCENPWKAWDGQPPCVAWGNEFTVYREIPNPLASASDSWIARHWRKLCEVYGMPHDEARNVRGYDGGTMADARRRCLDDWRDDAKPCRYGGREYLKITKALCALRGWPIYRATSRGYSQGDWADVLLVFSPDYAEEIGRPWPRSAKAKAAAVASLKQDFKLWSAWAWGDVYGYILEGPDGEELDSCWGYYGTDFDESGLAEAAESAWACRFEEARKRRADKLKSLIRSRAPLACRAAALESVA